MVQSYAHAERIWQSSCHNKPPDRKWDWTAVGVNWKCGWRYAQMRYPENLSILKRVLVEVDCWVFRIRSDHILWVSTGRDELRFKNFKHHNMCRSWWWGVSIVWLAYAFMICVSLLVSPRLKQEINKPVCKWNEKVGRYRYLYYYYWHHQINRT